MVRRGIKEIALPFYYVNWGHSRRGSAMADEKLQSFKIDFSPFNLKVARIMASALSVGELHLPELQACNSRRGISLHY
jgi:hypothetical protein